tara:strand:- start:28 stop:606 length:579 start_codon:yes stop_codon:yes gene_type:complete
MVSQIKVNEIIKQSGSSITIGESGTTISIPSGATIANSGTATGFGGDSTPAFFAYASSNQDISDDTATKVTLGTEVFDTDSAFSSNRFTVPSGEQGKYFFTYSVDCHSLANSNMDYSYVYIYKNGSNVSEHAADFRSNPPRRISVKGSIILDLSASDYIELYVNINDNSGSPRIIGDSGISTYLGAHKLIGV